MATSIAAPTTKVKNLRILISSPGDVEEERDRARQVIEGLRRRYARHFYLKPIRWEDLPLQADMSFQQGIDLVLSHEQGLDLAIFILWSKFGSPQNAALRKRDGSPYRSGTEREFDLMLEARAQSGGVRPHILVYTRADNASFDERLRGISDKDKKNLIHQKELVESFILEEFQDAATKVNVRAYHSFDQPVTFSQRLRAHLTELFDELAGGITDTVWDIERQGPPFLGLQPFQPEHANVFFGREDEVLEVRHALREQARNGCAFVLLSGASGSGKSSLARAGVLPAIIENEIDEQVAAWRTIIFTPSELAPDPLSALVYLMIADGVLPELRSEKNNDSVDDLAEALRKDPDLTLKLQLKPAFTRAAKRAGGEVRLLVVLDQLEELFASTTIDADDRASFLSVLETLARCGSVWVIATARSDFNPQIQTEDALVRLKAGRGTVDVLPPTPDAFRRIIEEPARLAGLHFEQREGHSLSDRILRESATRPELLPLVEDVLRELFEKGKNERRLTFAAYDDLGGVEGALVKRADIVFGALPRDAQECLGAVLNSLVTLGVDNEKVVSAATDEGRLVRQSAPLSTFPENTGARALVNAFVEHRLFTAGERVQTGEASVTVSHESLLRTWPPAVAWAAHNRDFLRVRARIAARQQDGSQLSEGEPLLGAASAYLAREDGFTPEQRTFIELNLARIEAGQQHRAQLRRRVMVGLSVLTLFSLAGFAWALWQTLEKNKQFKRASLNEEIATKQAERVRQSNSRSEFVTAMQLISEDRADQALAHLAHAIRLDAGNSAAVLRLYTLLGQRSWPLLLRTFPNSNAVRHVRLLPDQRRLLFGCSGEEGNFEYKNVSSIQLWDWTTDRILAPPDNQSRRAIADINISPDGRIAGIERSGKAGLNDNLVSFVPLLGCDAPSVTINVAATEAETAFKATNIDCLNDDGSFALVSGIWAEKTSEEQDQFGCHAIMPTVNNLQTTDRRLHFLFWEKKPSAKTLSGLSKENWVSLNSLPKQDSLLATRFDGRAVLLLFGNGTLYRFDPNGNVLSKMRAFDPKPGSSFLRGAFAGKSPFVALVRSDGTIEIANWRDGKRIAGPVSATDGNQWLAEYLPNAPRQENTGPPPDFALRFVNDDQTVLIERPRDDGGGILASAIWDFATKEKKAKTDLQSFRSGIHLKGDSLLSTQAGKSESFLFDREGELLCEPMHHESEVLTADLLNENLFATGTQNGFVRVWTRLTAPFSHKPGEKATNSAPVSPTVIQYDGALAEASDGARLYVDDRIETLGEEVTAKVKVSDKEIEIHFPRWDRVYGGNFDRSGSRLVLFGGWGQIGSTAGANSQGACVFDAKTGKVISPLLAHPECTWAALDPAGKWIATIGNNYIQFWDARTFEPSGPRLVHNGAAWGAWNPINTQRFISMTGNAAMRIWNLDNETILREIASSEADDQSEYSPEHSCYNSLTFNATGDQFALRTGTITTSVDATNQTLFQWRGTITIGDAETGNLLTDPVSIGFGNLRFSYGEAVRLFDWSLPPPTPAEHEVTILASLAEAVGGYLVSEEGSTDVIADRAASFYRLRGALKQTVQNSFSSDLARKIVDLPEVVQFLAEEQRTLVKNLAEGRAAFHLTEVARGLWPAPSDWESVEDERDRLVARIDFDYLEEDEDIREARRLSPEGFDRMLRGMIDDLRLRSDPIATFAAIQFGARDPELLRRAGDLLQRLRVKHPASPDAEEGASEQTEQEAILQKWEKKLSQM